MVFVIEKIFSATEKILSTTETILSATVSMVSATETSFSPAENFFSLPGSTFFATDTLLSVVQKFAGDAPAVIATPSGTQRRYDHVSTRWNCRRSQKQIC